MRSRPSSRAVLALCALAVFTAWITWRAKALELGTLGHNAPSVLMGKPAPAFAIQSLEGREISLGDYRGKTLVVTFWASWCGPCRLEMPVLARFYRQQHKPTSDFEILAISTDDAKDAAESAAKSLKIPFAVGLDADNRVADSYHVDAIPTLFVADKTGKIIYSNTGYEMTLDFMLAQQLGIKNYTPVTGGEK
jgi:peroxiredoxin